MCLASTKLWLPHTPYRQPVLCRSQVRQPTMDLGLAGLWLGTLSLAMVRSSGQPNANSLQSAPTCRPPACSLSVSLHVCLCCVGPAGLGTSPAAGAEGVGLKLYQVGVALHIFRSLGPPLDPDLQRRLRLKTASSLCMDSNALKRPDVCACVLSSANHG